MKMYSPRWAGVKQVSTANCYARTPPWLKWTMSQYKVGPGQLDENSISQRVVSAVADARDEDPLELPPLYEVIDLDALDSLFNSGLPGGATGPGRVTFTFDDHEVVVHSNGDVDVTPPDEQAPASSGDPSR